MAIVRNPPIIASVAKADCGTSLPKIMVAPIKGAVNSHTRAHTTVEKAQIFFFSAHTSSPVQVVNSDRVDEIATLDTIAVTISNTTRWSSGTARIKIGYNACPIVYWSYSNLLVSGTAQAEKAKKPAKTLNIPE